MTLNSEQQKIIDLINQLPTDVKNNTWRHISTETTKKDLTDAMNWICGKAEMEVLDVDKDWEVDSKDVEMIKIKDITRYKEFVDMVFKENSELGKIGTKKEYIQYLATIFPNSKVKDILIHRGPEKIENFNKSKTKKINWNRFYFSPLNTGRYGQSITFVLLNIKNLAKPGNDAFIADINKRHPEYSEGKSEWFNLSAHIYANANKYGYDGVFAFEGTNDDEYSVYEPEQIHILGSQQDIKQFKKWHNRHFGLPK